MLEQIRKQLAGHLAQRLGNTVAYGPFKGMRLLEHGYWAYSDRASMLLGLYEQEILNVFSGWCGESEFLDIGAADGYYAVGALVSGRFKKTYAFELTEAGRRAIAATAQLNGCAEKISIHGLANEQTLCKLLDDEGIQPGLVLIDIEGAEFDLLTRPVLEKLQHATVIIELHEFIFSDGNQKRQKLLADSARWFDVEVFTTGARDLSGYEELKGFHDSQRWLVCSEGRPRRMEWLVLKPRSARVVKERRGTYPLARERENQTPLDHVILCGDRALQVGSTEGHYVGIPLTETADPMCVSTGERNCRLPIGIFEMRSGATEGLTQLWQGKAALRLEPSSCVLQRVDPATHTASDFRILPVTVLSRLQWALDATWLDEKSPDSSRRLVLSSEGLLRIAGHSVAWDVFTDPASSGARSLQQGRLVTADGKVFCLFRPLVYFNVFGKQHMFEMLRLALLTLHQFSGVELSYLIVSDRHPDALSDVVPQAIRARTQFIQKPAETRNDMLKSRYQIDGYPLDGFGPILYLDVDIVCNRALGPLLRRMACDQRMHVGTEYRGQTMEAIGNNARWYGQFLFMMAKMPHAGRLCYNSGAMGFSSASVAKPHFDEALGLMDMFISHGSPAVDNLGDQPFLSFVIQKNRVDHSVVMDQMIDIVFIETRSVTDARHPKLGLIHFNRGVGNAAKLTLMMDYYVALCSETQ